jgi:sialic acid synthase SpsE
MKTTITLRSGVRIGHGQPTFIVAEIGNNHQGRLEMAKEMVYAAAEVGAGGVKFQKRDTDALLTHDGKAKPYTGPNSFGPTYGEHRDALELSIEEMHVLKELSEKLGLVFFASAWDPISTVQMIEMDVELHKICSADLVNIPLIRQLGATGVPVILSTGMSTWQEIDRSVAELKAFHDDIILLHCNSSYPCPEEEIALPVMQQLGTRYGLPYGYSGHERDMAPSLASVALGACVVERHFTLNKNLPGTDHKASLEPEMFKNMIAQIREIEKALQLPDKLVHPKEQAAAQKLRKSIVAAREIPAGTTLTPEDITVKSPATGISPLHWDEVIGRRVTRSLGPDDFLDWDALAGERVQITLS